MAEKKQVKLGILSRSTPAKTEPSNADLDSGKITAIGVGITTGELAALSNLAAQYGLTKNALTRFAIRRLLVDVRSGALNIEQELLEPEPIKPKLKLPK